MPITQVRNFIRSDLLRSPTLIHGISTRIHGDARKPAVRDAILAGVGLVPDLYTGVKQVHGTHVAVLRNGQADGADEADGLVTRESGAAIGVVTADCVPILLADMTHGVVGAVHAGWKGTAGEVAKHAVESMCRLGAKPDTIQCFIGPHIGACCYTVDSERADLFSGRYPESGVTYREGETWHLGLAAANRIQLIEAGVPQLNIDYALSCTSCQINRFYSYRKDTKETFGEMLSFISLGTGVGS